MVQRGAERSGTARCGAIRSGAARHGVESGTLFAIVKKSENQAGMVVRTRGTEKARKIGAAPFSVWFHRRRRLPPKRRRWFQECAELESRLSPSPPPPWREDAKIDDDDSKARLTGGGRGRGKGFDRVSRPREIRFSAANGSIEPLEWHAGRRGREREIRFGEEENSISAKRRVARRGAAWCGAARRGAARSGGEE